MPSSAINAPTHKNTLSKALGGVKKFFLNENDIKLNAVLNSSVYMQTIVSNSFIFSESKHFLPKTMEFWYCLFEYF